MRGFKYFSGILLTQNELSFDFFGGSQLFPILRRRLPEFFLKGSGEIR